MKKRGFEEYWRRVTLDTTLANANSSIYWGIKRQAKKAYEAGRKHKARARKP